MGFRSELLSMMTAAFQSKRTSWCMVAALSIGCQGRSCSSTEKLSGDGASKTSADSSVQSADSITTPETVEATAASLKSKLSLAANTGQQLPAELRDPTNGSYVLRGQLELPTLDFGFPAEPNSRGGSIMQSFKVIGGHLSVTGISLFGRPQSLRGDLEVTRGGQITLSGPTAIAMGSVNISGGTLATRSTAITVVGIGGGSRAHLQLSSGALQLGAPVIVGYDANSTGSMNVFSGRAVVRSSIVLGWGKDAVGRLEVAGGEVDATSGSIEVGRQGSASLDIKGGIVKTARIAIGEHGIVNISPGGALMIIGTDVSAAIKEVAAMGRFRSHNGGTLRILYRGGGTELTSQPIGTENLVVCGGDPSSNCYTGTTASAAFAAGKAVTPFGKKLVVANAADGFKVWKENSGKRILSATGLDEWQYTWGPGGHVMATFKFADAEQVLALLVGRSCPAQTYVDHTNGFAAGRCLYYDRGHSPQPLKGSAGPSGSAAGSFSWDRIDSGGAAEAAWYEVNAEVCTAQSMRLPTLYETASGAPTEGAPREMPANVAVMYSVGAGVPATDAGSIWTATAFAGKDPTQMWSARGGGQAPEHAATSESRSVRCVL